MFSVNELLRKFHQHSELVEVTVRECGEHVQPLISIYSKVSGQEDKMDAQKDALAKQGLDQ